MANAIDQLAYTSEWTRKEICEAIDFGVGELLKEIAGDEAEREFYLPCIRRAMLWEPESGDLQVLGLAVRRALRALEFHADWYQRVLDIYKRLQPLL